MYAKAACLRLQKRVCLPDRAAEQMAQVEWGTSTSSVQVGPPPVCVLQTRGHLHVTAALDVVDDAVVRPRVLSLALLLPELR